MPQITKTLPRPIGLSPGRLGRVLALLLMVSLAWMQTAAGATTELPPPADGILDDTRALEPATRALIAEDLKKLGEDLKCRTWLIAISFPPSGQNLRQYIRETRRHWSPDQPAILLGYDRSDNRLGYSFSPDIWNRHPAGLLADLTRRTDEIMAREGMTTDERLSLAVQGFSSTMRQLESVRLQQQLRFAAPEKKLFFLFAPLILIGAGIAAWFGSFSRKHEQHGSQEYHLPEVAVGQRLGAPYGGGLIVEARVSRGAA